MTVVTRIAPSPTGYLHIGTARTALFNYLFAKRHGGKFLLRIEDTDRVRSTEEATRAIISSLQWLGLQWDEEPYYQSKHEPRHVEVAHELLKRGKAFKCYTTVEQLAEWREKYGKSGRKFISEWRDGRKLPPYPDAPFVIRVRAPSGNGINIHGVITETASEGEIVINDKVQGIITVKDIEIDDITLLRSDGTPTYMLAVVVDDYDMNITHVIRGADHLTNTFRQLIIYQAMSWPVPEFAHIPLIHGADGAKLSKRHGAVGVETYRDMGYLPEALRNYLLRLGWAHGDDEIISDRQAIEWFSLEAIGKSPSRFDLAKLDSINGHYIREAEDARLVKLILPQLGNVDSSGEKMLLKAMPGLKQRAKTLKELAENAIFYVSKRPLAPDAKAKDILDKSRDILRDLLPRLEAQQDWNHTALEQLAREFAETSGQKLGLIAQPLRAALTGRTVSPGVFEVMEVLGCEESLGRIKDAC